MLLFKPLQRFAEFIADGAMPDTKPFASLDEGERVAFYREQVELMWMNEQMTAKDRMVLANLRQKLALKSELAETIELAVVRSGATS